MRSKIAQRILEETPKDIQLYVEKYADIVMLISQVLKSRKMTQKELAEKLEKRPSEISKWLNGEHNFTLKSLCKLEAELGVPLIIFPKTEDFLYLHSSAEKTYTVSSRETYVSASTFLKAETKIIKMNHGQTEKIA